jgi:uncharacterized protein (TIGR02246 family)
MRAREFLSTVVCAGLVGCVPAKTDVKVVRRIVDQQHATLVSAVANKDAAAIAALYDPDAQLFPPNGSLIAGRDSIRLFWKEAMRNMTEFNLETERLEVSMDLAYETGRYTTVGSLHDGKATTDTGKYVIVWKRMPHGAWLNAADIWNSSLSRQR